jgi:hypothetical protein
MKKELTMTERSQMAIKPVVHKIKIRPKDTHQILQRITYDRLTAAMHGPIFGKRGHDQRPTRT